MKLPIVIPQDRETEFQAWTAQLRRLFMLADISVGILEETTKFLFMKNLTPLEAIFAVRGMQEITSASSEELPFDEGAQYSLETNVVKTNSEHGDFTGDGTKGVIKGYKNVENYGGLYYVHWENQYTPLGEIIVNGVRAVSIQKEVS